MPKKSASQFLVPLPVFGPLVGAAGAWLESDPESSADAVAASVPDFIAGSIRSRLTFLVPIVAVCVEVAILAPEKVTL
ncbi:MAG: hypothetical protein EOR40_12880 [Mesorhizobium sp.]|nr:MAG: hypothetical protein EOR40_12880 [Mesorhizobium sp.]